MSSHLVAAVECATALVAALLFALLWRSVRRLGPQPMRAVAATATLTHLSLRRDLLRAAAPPLQFAAWYFCLYFALPLAIHVLKHPGLAAALERARLPFWHLGLLGGLFWFLYRCVDAVETRLAAIASATGSRFDTYLFPVLTLALRILIPVVGLISLLETLLLSFPMEASLLHDVWRAFGIGLVGCLAWIAHAGLVGLEKGILSGLDLDPAKTDAKSLSDRTTATRIRLLKKGAIVLNVLVAFAAALLFFPEARELGTSLLASAGLVGILIGFAAQRTLGTFFSGLQLALTHPIRLGDTVTVEGETGTVEEITLVNVTVRTWDKRARLIVPIASFLEKPFLNLSPSPASVVGQVKVRVDFALPVAAVREEAAHWLATHPLWDRQTFSLLVTDSDTVSMELRLLASAPSVADAFTLQCAAREWLLAHLAAKYPGCLPKTRERVEPEK